MQNIKLTVKQKNFCNKYVECGNASKAYRFAYSAEKMAQQTIANKASELLKHEGVSHRIQQLQGRLQTSSDISKQRILDELSAILDAKITDFVEFDGETLIFKDFSKLTENQLKAIESIKQGKGGVELKLHKKTWSIERISKMLGYDLPEKVEHSGMVVANISVEPIENAKQNFASSENEIDQ